MAWPIPKRYAPAEHCIVLHCIVVNKRDLEVKACFDIVHKLSSLTACRWKLDLLQEGSRQGSSSKFNPNTYQVFTWMLFEAKFVSRCFGL